MLIGREAEREVLERLLDAARRGRSGSLVVVGEPGIGKSTLLSHAVARASGFRMLRARGLEGEATLSFAGLLALFRPVLGLLDELPRPQAAALAGALALAPPAPGDRFTVAAAVLSLLAAVAEQQPVLVVADDAHWLDAASREALLFATRRLRDEAVVVLFAAREGEGEGVDWSGVDLLRLEGIDRRGSGVLLAQRTGRSVGEPVAERLCDATRGNPLAMLEIARGLSDQELAGRVTVAELPAAAGVEEAFRRRVFALPRDCRRALVVAAAGEALPVGQILAACTLLDLRSEALAPAQTRGIVAIEGKRMAFSHPITRRAVYDGAADDDRRAAHQALARILGAEDESDRHAWHLGQAAAGPNGAAAAALEHSAVTAVARNAPAAAADLFSRAGELAVDADDREGLLLQAARQWQLAGSVDRSISLLDQVLAGITDPLRRADAQRLRAAMEASAGHVEIAVRLLVKEAAAVERTDPEKAVVMLIDACGLTWLSGHARDSLPIARQCYTIAQSIPEFDAAFAAMTLGTSLVLCGEPGAGRQLVLEHATVPDADAPLVLSGAQGFGLLWSDEFTRAHEYLDALCARARASSAPSLLCPALVRRSHTLFCLGRWPSAYADAAESLNLAQATSQRLYVCYSLALMAVVEAARGEDSCPQHAAHAVELAEAQGIGIVHCLALGALGHYALAVQRTDSAITPLEDSERLLAEWGVNPAVIHSAPDLIEAYVRVGRVDQARQRLDTLLAQASRSASILALASAYRCEGMLAAADEYDPWFERALAEHQRLPTPFDRARTELCYGERLRRGRRKTDARTQLDRAQATFDRLGARPWADRTRAELRALGIRVPHTHAAASGSLTPQELQVARTVSQGATNREAAAALFLSPKTIEAHLSSTYRKLGVRSRTELATLLARDGSPDPELPVIPSVPGR